MLTKGIVLEKKLNSNKYIVRIPYFEEAGIIGEKDKLNSPYFEATLCYTTGNYNGLNVGDVVILGFEDHEPNQPIIIGKLFTNKSLNEKGNFAKHSSLEVKDKVDLPEDTYINGTKYVDYENKIKDIDKKINEVNSTTEELTKRINGVDSKTNEIDKRIDSIISMKPIFRGLLSVESNKPIDETIINADILSKYDLITMQFYFGTAEWSKQSFTITVNAKPLVNNDIISCPIVGVGDDNVYIKLYGVKIYKSNPDSNAINFIVANGQSTQQKMTITSIDGFINNERKD